MSTLSQEAREREKAFAWNDDAKAHYVRPFPDVTGGHWQVSTAGGTRPLWAHSGQELFYLAPDAALMRVAVERGPTWAATTPTKLLEGRYFAGGGGFPSRTYDISPDDRRFLMLKAAGGTDGAAAPTSGLVVIQNWGEELKRLVPTK